MYQQKMINVKVVLKPSACSCITIGQRLKPSGTEPIANNRRHQPLMYLFWPINEAQQRRIINQISIGTSNKNIEKTDMNEIIEFYQGIF